MKKKYVKHLLKCLYNLNIGSSEADCIFHLDLIAKFAKLEKMLSQSYCSYFSFYLTSFLMLAVQLLGELNFCLVLLYTALLFTRLCRYPSGLKPVIIHVKKYRKLGFY